MGALKARRLRWTFRLPRRVRLTSFDFQKTVSLTVEWESLGPIPLGAKQVTVALPLFHPTTLPAKVGLQTASRLLKATEFTSLSQREQQSSPNHRRLMRLESP